MIVQNQYESTFSDKIKDINWYTQAFELNSNRNFTFNDGSIVIRNGRLQDTYALNANSDVLVVADGRGLDRMAGIVYVYNEDINNSNIGQRYLYSGRLDQIIEDRVWLEDYFILNQNEWESFSDTKELFYDNDTSIYDLEDGRFITPKEFVSGDYSMSSTKDHHEDCDRGELKDWYGYVYTDGDRIAAISVQKDMDSLLRQRVTNGIVSSIEDDPTVGWNIVLRNSNDWSNYRSQWMPKNSDLRINIDSAAIIKNGSLIKPQEINSSDRLYVVRMILGLKLLLLSRVVERRVQ